MRRSGVVTVVGATMLAVAAGGCAGSSDEAAEQPAPTTVTVTTTLTVETAPPPFSTPHQLFPPYEPPAEETYRNGKRLAGRIAQTLATFEPGTTAAELAEAAGVAGEATVAPLVDPTRRSAGEVVYVQLSGLTETTLGTMVVVRQHLEDGEGNRQVVERVMDVRLTRTNGPWSVERVVSVGGKPFPRPAKLPPAAERVVDHPNIDLPDTARWDVYRGNVDEALLRTLAELADRWPLAVTVFRSGHPQRVWGTERTSAHTTGFAVDIYAVAGELVVRQRESDGQAKQLAAAFVARGARQVGSPWILPPGGKRSFTDRVHEDHIHVQQSPSFGR